MAYSQKVLDHYENPRNVGSFDKGDDSVGTGMVGAPACGDVMKLQIKVNLQTGLIEDARFKTYGCVTSNTMVNTPTCAIPIEKLKIGDLVLAWNGSFICANEVQLITTSLVSEDNLVRVTFARDSSRAGVNPLPFTITCTRDHIWWSSIGNPVEAQELKSGDEVLEITENELRRITNVRHREEFKRKSSERMSEFNKHFDHSSLPQNQKGFVHAEGFRKKISEASIKLWTSADYRVRWAKGMAKIERTAKTTTIEKEFMAYVQDMNLPINYVAGKKWIQTSEGPKSPDFEVVGKRKLIEVYTENLPSFMEDRSQSSNYVKNRTALFAEHGYETLCVPMNRFNEVAQEVQQFVHNGIKVLSVEPITHANQLRGVKREGSKVVVFNIALKEGANVMFFNRAASHNCGSAIASSSLVTEWVKGKTLDQAVTIKNTHIAEELALPPVKIHCSILAEDAIKAAVQDYKAKHHAAAVTTAEPH